MSRKVLVKHDHLVDETQGVFIEYSRGNTNPHNDSATANPVMLVEFPDGVVQAVALDKVRFEDSEDARKAKQKQVQADPLDPRKIW